MANLELLKENFYAATQREKEFQESLTKSVRYEATRMKDQLNILQTRLNLYKVKIFPHLFGYLFRF